MQLTIDRTKKPKYSQKRVGWVMRKRKKSYKYAPAVERFSLTTSSTGHVVRSGETIASGVSTLASKVGSTEWEIRVINQDDYERALKKAGERLRRAKK